MEKTIRINLNKVEDIKKFYNVVITFTSDIDVISGNTVIDGKSLLGLYSLDLSKSVETKIISDNEEERRRFDSEMEAFR